MASFAEPRTSPGSAIPVDLASGICITVYLALRSINVGVALATLWFILQSNVLATRLVRSRTRAIMYLYVLMYGSVSLYAFQSPYSQSYLEFRGSTPRPASRGRPPMSCPWASYPFPQCQCTKPDPHLSLHNAHCPTSSATHHAPHIDHHRSFSYSGQRSAGRERGNVGGTLIYPSPPDGALGIRFKSY